MIKSDKYGIIMNYKIEVMTFPCEEKGCGGYHYYIMGLYAPHDKQIEPYWFETGVEGVEPTVELAFEMAFQQYNIQNN